MRRQTEVCFVLAINQHLQQTPSGQRLCIYHDSKNAEHSFSGCPGDANHRVWEVLVGRRNSKTAFNDAGERHSGTPNDEQGLSYSHTPLPEACVFTGYYTDSPGDTCACLPYYNNYCGEITDLLRMVCTYECLRAVVFFYEWVFNVNV